MRSRGVTLVEMMVAVAITGIMLAASGIVFKKANDASGKAMAANEMMRELRAVTRQLDDDFKGIRKDMPIAIIFEQDVVTGIRRDRIVFFANGDFQDINGLHSGNLARIFYGQTNDEPYTPPDSMAPLRQFLARRYKIMTGDSAAIAPYDDTFWSSYFPEEYDKTSFERASVAYWRNVGQADYVAHFFKEDAKVSFIRRPVFGNTGTNVQQMYFLSDVTDLKIQIWDGFRWYPDENDFLANDSEPRDGIFALYWNAPAGVGLDDWRLCPAIPTLNPPQAIKFTFTLYDKNRVRFPEGKTFSYIVRL